MLATVLQAVGMTVVAIGVGLWFPPAGIVVAGIGFVLFGLALERK
jgi:hypothetical protein